MNRGYDRTLHIVTERGLAVGHADTASSGWSVEVSGPPWTNVSANSPVRIDWDSTNRRLIVRQRTGQVLDGNPIWDDLWIARNIEERTPELAVTKVQEFLSSVLIGIGYWHSTGAIAATRFPHPQGVVLPGWEREKRIILATYLRSGKTAYISCGFSYCRFACGVDDTQMGTRGLTDGRWLWPEGLHHYVERHSVRLPDEFVAHASARRFEIPPEEVGDLNTQFSLEFWEAWCDRNATFNPEPTCMTCGQAADDG